MDVRKLWLLIFILFSSCGVSRSMLFPPQFPHSSQLMSSTFGTFNMPQSFPPQFNKPDEFFTSWGQLQASCDLINRDNAVYKSIPYSGFFDQLCKVAKAFMPNKKDIEAVAKQAEPEATSLNLPRLRKLRERMQQRARSMQAEIKLASKSADKNDKPRITRRLR